MCLICLGVVVVECLEDFYLVMGCESGFNFTSFFNAAPRITEQFDYCNVGITAHEVRMGRNRSAHADPIIALTVDAARRSLLILNEAFFDCEQFKLCSLICCDELSYSLPSMPGGREIEVRSIVSLLMDARATPQSSQQFVLPSDIVENIFSAQSIAPDARGWVCGVTGRATFRRFWLAFDSVSIQGHEDWQRVGSTPAVSQAA